MAKITVDELKTLLKSEGEWSDDQLTGLSKKQLEYLADGYMRQADYDRSVQEGKAELAKAQTELDAATQRLNTEMVEWGKVMNGDKAATAKQQRDLEAAQSDVLRLRQAVTRIGQENNIDVSKVLDGAPPPAPVDKPTPIDTSKFVSTDQFNQQLGALANMSLTLPATLFTLAQEHQTLFGQPLNAQAIIEEIQARAGTLNNKKSLDPRTIWEELNKVADKRADVAKADRKKLEDDAFERGRQAAISESAIPGQTTAPGRHSPIFGDKGRQSTLKRPQPGERVGAAAAALRSGKYREGVAKVS